jgi:hypothetical protein
MRHLLMDPAFPDIVGEWARQESCGQSADCANDNEHDDEAERDALSDPLLALIARAEIEATRIW